MATPAKAIETEIQRATEKLRSLAQLRPDVAANCCRDIVEYESALVSERNSMRGRLKYLGYFNRMVGGNIGEDSV